MSLVKVAGNASGTGTITIQAPNTNTNYTLDLPAAAGTIQLSGNAISGTTGTFSGTISGGSTIGVGGATPANTGAGITFPATQSASTDANTLDDYEEGDWTPTITAGVSNPTVTYSVQTGKYTKIGRMVSIQGRVQISAISGGSGNFRLSGLPFTNAASIVGAGTSWFSAIDLSAGYSVAGLYFSGNNAFLDLAESGDNVGASQMPIGVIGATFDIAFAFTYITS